MIEQLIDVLPGELGEGLPDGLSCGVPARDFRVADVGGLEAMLGSPHHRDTDGSLSDDVEEALTLVLRVVAGVLLPLRRGHELLFHPSPAYPCRHHVRHRRQGDEGLFGQGVPGEDSHHPHHPGSELQRVAGKGDHPLAPSPAGVSDIGVVKHIVGEVGKTVLRDTANFELPHRHPRVRPIQVRVLACARLQLEGLRGVVQQPHPRKGGVEVAVDGLRALLEHGAHAL